MSSAKAFISSMYIQHIRIVVLSMFMYIKGKQCTCIDFFVGFFSIHRLRAVVNISVVVLVLYHSSRGCSTPHFGSVPRHASKGDGRIGAGMNRISSQDVCVGL